MHARIPVNGLATVAGDTMVVTVDTATGWARAPPGPTAEAAASRLPTFFCPKGPIEVDDSAIVATCGARPAGFAELSSSAGSELARLPYA